MKTPTASKGMTLRSVIFQVLPVVTIIALPVLFVAWVMPSLTLHLLVVWGGAVLLLSLPRFLMSVRR